MNERKEKRSVSPHEHKNPWLGIKYSKYRVSQIINHEIKGYREDKTNYQYKYSAFSVTCMKTSFSSYSNISLFQITIKISFLHLLSCFNCSLLSILHLYRNVIHELGSESRRNGTINAVYLNLEDKKSNNRT